MYRCSFVLLWFVKKKLVTSGDEFPTLVHVDCVCLLSCLEGVLDDKLFGVCNGGLPMVWYSGMGANGSDDVFPRYVVPLFHVL